MIWANGIHAHRPHPCLCHMACHILAVMEARKPLYFNGFRHLSKITKVSHRIVFNAVQGRNWLCDIFQLRASLDIMLQGHCRCGMTSGGLSLFYVLRDFVARDGVFAR